MQKALTYIGYLLGYKFLLWLLLLVTAGYIGFRPGYEYTIASYTLTHTSTPTQHLFYSLANFDGIHYINIAQRGYVDEARFFPLYPISINIVSWPFRLLIAPPTALIFASLVISFGALIAAIYLLKEMGPSKLSNWRLALTVIAFPTSFFLVATYTESLFLVLVLVTLWLAKTKHWYLACLAAAFASITRLVGIVVWVALVWEWLHQTGVTVPVSSFSDFSTFKKALPKIVAQIRSSVSQQWLLAVCLVLSLAPLFMYLWYNQTAWGDSLYFLHAHQQLGNGRSAGSLVNPLVTIYRYARIILSLPISQYEWQIAVMEVIFTMAGIGSLVWAGYKKLLPITWLTMCWGFLLIPIFSGTLTGMPRYVLICFPLYWILAQLPTKWWWSYVVGGLILNLGLFLLFAHGYYIA